MADLARTLAASGDPSVAWLARTRLLAAAATDPGMAALRAAIATSDRARALLSHRAADGTIPLHAYAKWQGPHWTLVSLAQIGYPEGDEGLRPLKRQVDDWLFDRAHGRPPRTVRLVDQPDRIRRCASQEGNAIRAALALGLADDRTVELAERLVALQWPDGGWNCDKRPAARASSFQETTIPAGALHAFGRRFGHAGALDAAARAAELLLSRRLLWRLRDGALIRPEWGGAVDLIQFPFRFHDVLFVLETMGELGRLGDPRCADALALLRAKELPDGGFPLELPTAVTRDRVASRGTFADWGPAGRRRSNPFVSIAALHVLAAAEGASDNWGVGNPVAGFPDGQACVRDGERA